MENKFKKALIDMYKNHEFEKMVEYNKKEAKKIEADKKLVACLMDNFIPFIVLIQGIQSADTLKDAIVYMVGEDKYADA